MPKINRGGAPEPARERPEQGAPTEQQTGIAGVTDHALAVALTCASFGWPVFPVNSATKVPAVKGWQTVATRDPDVIRGWFGRGGQFPLAVPGIPTGRPSGLLVVDFDVASEAHPNARGGDTQRAKAAQWEHEGGWGEPAVARTSSGGLHNYYAYPAEGTGADADPNYRIGNRSALYGKDSGVDLRGDGGFVVAGGLPGREWIIEPTEQLAEPPAWLLSDLKSVGATSEKGERPTGRSTLAELMQNPPDGEGGRNDWLARVAGQLAARENHRDTYLVQVREQAAKLTPPLPAAEVDKVAGSIWKAERRKQAEAQERTALDEPAQDEMELATIDGRAGYLAPGRGPGGVRLGTLLYRGWVGSGDTRQPAWFEWADFDLEAVGVLQEDDARTYDVRMYLKRGVEDKLPPRQLQVDARTLADTRKLNAWLASQGATIEEGKPAVDRMDRGARVQRYLDNQRPPAFQVVPHLGWHADIRVPEIGQDGQPTGKHRIGGFVTPDGVITVDGKYTGPGVRPSPAAAELVQFRYGVDRDEAEARAVLRELLTFHHEQTASVFGAWWAAALVKHAVMQATGAFPFMAIEAPSESGKTTGMFGLLIQLAGNKGGQSVNTKPAFRDALSANRNGIVWLDDADTIGHLEEVMRAATSEGSMTKKAEDRTQNVTTRLVAPFVISGENLGLTREKALIDRSIRLKVASPTKRRSQRKGAPADRLQWADIVELSARYDRDLTVLAGTVVRMALRHADALTEEIRQLRGSGGGRMGDAMAVLQAGARLLAKLTGDPHHVDVVARWVDEQADYGDENALTLSVLPRLLDRIEPPAEPTRSDSRFPAPITPFLLRGERLWVNAELTAAWLEHLRLKTPGAAGRNETAEALRAQLDTLSDEPGVRRPVSGDKANKRTYRPLSVVVSARLLQGVSGGQAPTDPPLTPADPGGPGGQGVSGVSGQMPLPGSQQRG